MEDTPVRYCKDTKPYAGLKVGILTLGALRTWQTHYVGARLCTISKSTPIWGRRVPQSGAAVEGSLQV